MHHKPKFVFVILFAFVLSNPTMLPAQSESDKLSVKQESEINSNIYSLTSNAKTAADFTGVIEACEQALQKPLSKKTHDYVVTMKSYCLNQRGSRRLDLAENFRSANNQKQADTTAIAAKQDFDQSIESDKNLWSAYVNRAAFYAQKKNYHAALKDLDSALQIKPGVIAAIFNRAEINYHVGRFDEAAKDYSQILDAQSGNLQAITGRAHCWFAQGKYNEALSEYEIVLKLKPNDPVALVNRGDVHQAQGNWKAAYDDYIASASNQPTAIAYQQAAWLNATCPDAEFYQPETAKALIEKALELEKVSPRGLDVQAAVFATLGEFDKAVDTQEKAIELAGLRTNEMNERLDLYRANKAYQQADPRK